MSGYRGFHTKEFVEDEDAFEYAFEKVMNDEEEQQEFFGYLRTMFEHDAEERQTFVDWFFSGNWIRVKE